MVQSLRNQPSFIRPRTSDRERRDHLERPITRDGNDNAVPIPSRTSSLHSRITQPIPSTLNIKVQPRTPKTLTHAYLVCGVGREPSQWVKAPTLPQGKIMHMKGAVNQFWLPEILGSSPRLEQDNDMARALHAAMRVSFNHIPCLYFETELTGTHRLASRTMSRSAQVEPSRIVFTTPLCCSKTPRTPYTASPCACGQEQMRSAPKPSANCASGTSRIITRARMRRIGFHMR